jgi:hypothetical protein
MDELYDFQAESLDVDKTRLLRLSPRQVPDEIEHARVGREQVET